MQIAKNLKNICRLHLNLSVFKTIYFAIKFCLRIFICPSLAQGNFQVFYKIRTPKCKNIFPASVSSHDTSVLTSEII